ncbi:MAG: class I SAM-dependent methyltransferase [Firmicutes bacterium]|nr:class I SAM-dependent methyltransferase [Bacillota bacterium]
MNSANEKTNEIKKLAGIEKLRFDIEKRLIKLSKSTKNDPFQMSSNLDAIDRSTGAPLRDVYEMVLQAERATTVKSFLPKFLNLFLRKQNIVNRRLITAIRLLAESLSNCLKSIENCDHNIIINNQKNVNNTNDIIDLKFVISNLVEPSVKDHFYYEFTNRYRGSFEMITNRLAFYVFRLKQHFDTNAMQNMLGLDLGSGRGEWLDLMKVNSFPCIGVESNSLFYNDCKLRNLDVRNIDIFDALGDTADESYDLISAFHVVEHFKIDKQLNFFSEIFRVLKKGGIIFIETPYNANLDVGATGFYHDPTHIRPLHEDLGKFIIEYVGFSDIEIHHLNPADTSYEDGNTFDKRMCGPRDLAIIGKKI